MRKQYIENPSEYKTYKSANDFIFYESVNEFMRPIFMKEKKHDFRAWLMLRKVIKRMNKISPDFDTMYKIWQMVESFHSCFMHTYAESSPLHLFLGIISKGYGDSYAMLYKENDFIIKFILQFKDDHKIINLEITRSSNNRNIQPEKISFENGTYQCSNAVEMEKFRFIISCLMNGAKELMLYYYNNKRF